MKGLSVATAYWNIQPKAESSGERRAVVKVSAVHSLEDIEKHNVIIYTVLQAVNGAESNPRF